MTVNTTIVRVRVTFVQYNCYIGHHKHIARIAIQLLYWAPLLLNINICAIQLLYWAPQTYRTRHNTIVILGTTLAQHKHLCKYNCYIGASYSYYALLNYYWPTTDKETSTIALTQYTI